MRTPHPRTSLLPARTRPSQRTLKLPTVLSTRMRSPKPIPNPSVARRPPPRRNRRVPLMPVPLRKSQRPRELLAPRKTPLEMPMMLRPSPRSVAALPKPLLKKRLPRL